MSDYTPTPRTTLHRRPARGTYDRVTVHAILDEALVGQLGFVVESQPFVLPVTFARDGERIFLHAASAGRMARTLAEGAPACLSVSLLDGLVLARSAFHHSMNYRSVVVLGAVREVTDPSEKLRALSQLVDKISPGRSVRVRPPNDNELRATAVLELPLEEVSAKIRVGPPIGDDERDVARAVWAGVVPLALRAGCASPSDPDDGHLGDPPLPRGLAIESAPRIAAPAARRSNP
jgi:nitroimidazol reductase NimA-like FMN-containing flavoprotein (pyridoxamine 5'-phosphate oxidase superfamily)